MSRYTAGVLPYLHELRESAFSYDALVGQIDEVLRGAPGRNVLSLGCGTGSVELRLARRGHSVRAVDFDPSVADFARRLFAEAGISVEVTVADVTASASLPSFDAVLVLYSEFPVAQLRSLAVKAAGSANPGALFLANIPFSPRNNIGCATSFVDILGHRPGVCLSEYRRERAILRGQELYVVDRGDGLATLMRDYTCLPLEFETLEDLRAEAARWAADGWSLDRTVPLGTLCPSAAPPFCDQALLVWRLVVGRGGESHG